MRPWIGVDFDGTLAEYHGWTDEREHIAAAPIPAMVRRVTAWLAAGKDVRIVTARVARVASIPDEERWLQRRLVQDWCLRNVGIALPVTATKDMAMVELWDDRAVAVERNTGRVLGGESAYDDDDDEEVA